MCYCPTPTLHLNLALTGDGAFIFSLKKTHSVWSISVLNYGDTENVLINHLLLVIPMSYPCHYTNLCPHKPHKHAHTHTHTNTHTHTHTHAHTRTHTHTHTHIHTHTHTHTHRHTHAHTHTHRHTHAHRHTHTHTHSHTHTHISLNYPVYNKYLAYIIYIKKNTYCLFLFIYLMYFTCFAVLIKELTLALIVYY